MAIKRNPHVKNIITITGDLGSGKSTVAKLIAEKTGMEYFSTGKIQRKIAEELGIDTLELNKRGKKDKSTDNLIDGKLKAMNHDGTDNIILDSRMAWHFVGNSFKIYLTAIPLVAAERVCADKTRTGEPVGDVLTTCNNLLARQKEENERFSTFYNVDCKNLDNFDLVIDTSTATPEQITDLILALFNDRKKGIVHSHQWISPKDLIPCQDIRTLANKEQALYSVVKEKGFDEKCPVEIIEYKNAYYIFDGHHRTSAAIKSNLSLIPYVFAPLTEKQKENHVKTTCWLSSIYDWEDFHNMTFKTEYLKDVPTKKYQNNPKQPTIKI